MTTIIQLDQEELKTEIRQVLYEVLKEQRNKVPEPTLPERGGIELAMQVLKRSKSWIYKGTSQGIVPHRKFGSKIIFNRTDLEAWLNEKSVDPMQEYDAIIDKMAESANKKLTKV